MSMIARSFHSYLRSTPLFVRIYIITYSTLTSLSRFHQTRLRVSPCYTFLLLHYLHSFIVVLFNYNRSVQ